MASMSVAELQREYSKRGYFLAYAGGRYIITKKDDPMAGQLKLYDRGRVEDVDGAIEEFEKQKKSLSETYAIHDRLTGKELWEMTFSDWWEWQNVDREADRLMHRTQRDLFPGKSTADLRRESRGNPDGVVGYIHQKAVEKAIAEGKVVPQNVLDEIRSPMPVSSMKATLRNRTAAEPDGEDNMHQLLFDIAKDTDLYFQRMKLVPDSDEWLDAAIDFYADEAGLNWQDVDREWFAEQMEEVRSLKSASSVARKAEAIRGALVRRSYISHEKGKY